ncbi:MAG: sigma-70 family RNA polymerase sigma factor [Alphaproteobacteria bacterium]|nr:sigma-70 family RNA polymerase sigma factor [Alphaproteobacteria bacterium]
MTDRPSDRETHTALSKNMTAFDDPVIRAAIAGDKQAFAALFDKHYDLIYRIALQYTRNQTDAQDIAQDTCVKLARKLGCCRFESKFTTWLYRLTLNTAKDWQRKACRRYEKSWPEEFDPVGPEATPERRAITREFLRAVEDLPEKLKSAVLLVFRDGLSHGQAADSLGCAETTVSWRIHEARKVLSRQWQHEDLGNSHA